jgi:hypothetical protein
MIKKNISLKGIPVDLYENIKKRAERNHRSVNSEIIDILSKASSDHHRLTYELVLERTTALKKQMKGRLTAQEIQEAIDEGRE